LEDLSNLKTRVRRWRVGFSSWNIPVKSPQHQGSPQLLELHVGLSTTTADHSCETSKSRQSLLEVLGWVFHLT
jgi:hypothetical protein